MMHKLLPPYYWSRLRNPKPHQIFLFDGGEVLKDAAGTPVPHPFAKLIGLTNKQAIEAAVAIGRNASFEMEIDPQDREETIRQFVEYAIHFAGDGWMPLEIETSFSKVLYSEPDVLNDNGEVIKEGITIVMEGVVDLYADAPHLGKIVVDHKTTKRRETPSDLSNQFMNYSWAMETRNVYVNRIGFQKTLAPSVRFQRISLSYSTPRIQEWRYWTIYWAKLYQFYLDNGVWPPNWTSCDKYDGCIYKPVCEAIPEAREDRIAVLYRKGDPWSPHDRDAKYLAAMVEEE